ncbi:beta strand repeat-containing protein [Sphingomonas adhaesiva]|uniref:beta strand repeat-containing protein n=1 Tax=Sphingomonas adhaesiva TaxID=28212 RepID=UPI003FA6A962
MSVRSTMLRRGSAGTLCSVVALATALVAGPAQAQQSYNLAGNPTVTSGTVTVDRGITIPGTEVYTIGSATAVIDMVPADTATGGGVINFQNANTTALYTSTPGGPAFTVLNRIVPADPARPIAFNGNVVSQLQSAAGAAARGGTVWFYSPGGIVLGDGAVFDVGNLLLSTGDPAGGGTTIGSTGSFNLTSTANGGGIVNILSGARINATNPGSYVALVAPIVFQRGTVNVNGAAAYVAAEQASLTFDQGLFDINVTVGSSAAGGFPLQHLGTTRFQNVATPSRAYLVSVPKNDAITLVIGASADIGFDVATTVGVENGLIVLGAGFRNVGGTPDVSVSSGFANPSAQTPAYLGFDGGGRFNAGLVARARDDLSAVVDASTYFGSNVSLRGGGSGSVVQAGASGAGTVLTIRGNLTLDATAPGINSAAAQTGGIASLTALAGGTTQIGGNVRIDAGQRGNFLIAGANGASTGGNASIVAQAGTISIGGNADVLATGSSASTATGGVASATTGAGFALTVGGNLNINASASGLDDTAAIGNASGGDAIGGTASITSGGNLQVTGQIGVLGDAFGGRRLGAGAGSGGSATGGTATITTLAGGRIASDTIRVSAFAASGGTAGDGTGAAATGGDASLFSVGTTATGRLFVAGDATSGGRTGGTGDVGTAVAGTAVVEANGGGVLTVLGDTLVSAVGTGGSVTAGTGSGGAGQGTTARLTTSTSGEMTLGSTTVVASGSGGAGAGAGGAGGLATGGLATLQQGSRGTIGVNGVARVSADGFGGASAAAAGGSAAGGEVSVVANDSSLSIGGNAQLSARGAGGSGVAGGAANGGRVAFLAGNGQALVILTAALDASAIGGLGVTGDGGAATAGTAQLGTNGTGSLTLGGTAAIAAGGVGGAGANGGSGTGGTSVLYALKGSLTVAGGVLMTASASGGEATGAGTAGSGTGGLSYITADAGTVQLSRDVSLAALGTGGGGVRRGRQCRRGDRRADPAVGLRQRSGRRWRDHGRRHRDHERVGDCGKPVRRRHRQRWRGERGYGRNLCHDRRDHGRRAGPARGRRRLDRSGRCGGRRDRRRDLPERERCGHRGGPRDDERRCQRGHDRPERLDAARRGRCDRRADIGDGRDRAAACRGADPDRQRHGHRRRDAGRRRSHRGGREPAARSASARAGRSPPRRSRRRRTASAATAAAPPCRVARTRAVWAPEGRSTCPRRGARSGSPILRRPAAGRAAPGGRRAMAATGWAARRCWAPMPAAPSSRPARPRSMRRPSADRAAGPASARAGAATGAAPAPRRTAPRPSWRAAARSSWAPACHGSGRAVRAARGMAARRAARPPAASPMSRRSTAPSMRPPAS